MNYFKSWSRLSKAKYTPDTRAIRNLKGNPKVVKANFSKSLQEIEALNIGSADNCFNVRTLKLNP
jgi:hypothetical protein